MQQEVKKELIFRIWVRFPVEEPMNAILEECPSEHAEREESRPPKSTDNHTSNYYYLRFSLEKIWYIQRMFIGILILRITKIFLGKNKSTSYRMCFFLLFLTIILAFSTTVRLYSSRDADLINSWILSIISSYYDFYMSMLDCLLEISSQQGLCKEN